MRRRPERLNQDPTFRLIGPEKVRDRGAALTSRPQSFEAEMLAEEQNFAGLARINRELVAKVEAIHSPQRLVLDMDSTGIPVCGQQENSARNGHFESTSYPPLLLFNREEGAGEVDNESLEMRYFRALAYPKEPKRGPSRARVPRQEGLDEGDRFNGGRRV